MATKRKVLSLGNYMRRKKQKDAAQASEGNVAITLLPQKTTKSGLEIGEGDMKRLGLVDPDSVQTSTTLSNVDSPPSVLGSPSHPDYTFEVPPPSIRSSQLDLSTGKGGAEDLIPATSHASSLDKPGIQPPGTSHEAVHLRQEAGAAVKTPCGEGAHRRGLRPTTKARVAPGVDGSRRKHSQYYQAEYPGRQVSLESKNDVRDLISLVYRNLDRLDNHPSNKPAKK